MSTGVILENLTLSYHRHPAVHHVSGEFAGGSLTAVTGPNGGGKSTLLLAMAGLIRPSEGRIILQGIGRKDIALLPQLSEIRMDFPINVLQMVSCGVWQQSGSMGSIEKASRTRAREALRMVGLEGFENRQLATLSAGQLQRALFARLILQDAKLLLLDEPFNGIDEETTQRLLHLIGHWHNEGRTIVCVVHDRAMIGQHFPRCLLIARECIAWGASADVLKEANLEKARHFHEAWQAHPEICHQ